jgi:hypothetical protein
MVIKNENGYKLLYLGGVGDKQMVYYASSEDGIIWTKYADYPVFDHFPQWMEVPLYDGGTFLETADGRLHFWYTGFIFDAGYHFWINPQIGYAADLKDLPIVRSLELDRTYIRTDDDTLIIKTQIENRIGHDIDVRAKFYNDITTFSEYVMLYDDGEHDDNLAQDSIYGGYWVCAEENTFKSIVEINDLSNGFTYNSIVPFNLEEQVTSIGPIEVEDFSALGEDTVANYGDIVNISLQLINLGSITEAQDISVRISSDDLDIDLYNEPAILSVGEIPAGGTGSTDGAFTFEVLEDSSSNWPTKFLVDISSGGYYFWQDSFIVDIVSGIEKSDQNIPTVFSLDQNYPNPFNPSTTIEFAIPKTEFVSVKIYNLLGQEVATLVSQTLKAGFYKYGWNASGLSSGVYYYSIKAGEFHDVKKMVLIR